MRESTANVDYTETWKSLTDLTNILRKDIEQSIVPTQLKLLEFRILNYLGSHGPATLARIANDLTVMRAGIALLMDEIEERGFVKRSRADEDRRVVFISLTPLGSKRLKTALKLQDTMVKQKMGRLSEKELNALKSLVDRLLSP